MRHTSTLVNGSPVDCNLKNPVAEFVVLWGRWLLSGHEERQAQPITHRSMSEFAVEEHERKERAPGENFSTGSRDHVAEERWSVPELVSSERGANAQEKACLVYLLVDTDSLRWSVIVLKKHKLLWCGVIQSGGLFTFLLNWPGDRPAVPKFLRQKVEESLWDFRLRLSFLNVEMIRISSLKLTNVDPGSQITEASHIEDSSLRPGPRHIRTRLPSDTSSLPCRPPLRLRKLTMYQATIISGPSELARLGHQAPWKIRPCSV